MTDAVREAAGARPRASELADDLSFLLARANALSVATGNAALAPFGLRVRSYSVLALAGGDARTSQREIAEYLRLDPSQVVALIDDLQAKGLVIRHLDPRDRRTNVVVATESGADVLARSRAAVLEAELAQHSNLSQSERTTLAELLQRLAFPGEPPAG